MYRKILVPIDGSATATRGLSEAIGLASTLKARLHLLHVIGDFANLVDMAAIRSFDESMAELRRQARSMLDEGTRHASERGVECEGVVREIRSGRIADIIVAEAKASGCDLIVMGTHGRRGFSRMALGSDADLVVRESSLPVLLVRHSHD